MWNVVVRKESLGREEGCPDAQTLTNMPSFIHCSTLIIMYGVSSHELTGIPNPRRNPCFGVATIVRVGLNDLLLE